MVQDFGWNYYQIDDNIYVSDWWRIFGKRFWLQLLSDWWQYFCDWLVENILVRDYGCNYYQIDDDVYVSYRWIILCGVIGDNTHIRLVKHSYDIASVFLSQIQAFFWFGYWFISHSLCSKINHHQNNYLPSEPKITMSSMVSFSKLKCH